MSLARLINSQILIDQHIAWMRGYLATMNENNWRDMQTMLGRQLDNLSPLISTRAADSLKRANKS